jgi:hypothetical protein
MEGRFGFNSDSLPVVNVQLQFRAVLSGMPS